MLEWKISFYINRREEDGIFCIVLCHCFLLVSLLFIEFQWSSEGKDERGQTILNRSYSIAFPLMPLGWLVIELINDYVYSMTYEGYKDAIWFLLTGLFILHAVTILISRRTV